MTSRDLRRPKWSGMTPKRWGPPTVGTLTRVRQATDTSVIVHLVVTDGTRTEDKGEWLVMKSWKGVFSQLVTAEDGESITVKGGL